MSERRRLPFEVAPGCYAVDRCLGAWCYLLTGATTLLVDTGIPGRAGAILRAVRAIGIEPSAIDRIVLTHFDMDHSGSAAALHRRTGAPVVIHEADVPYLAAPETTPGLRSVLYWPLITWITRWRPPTDVTPVGEGDMIGDWLVLHTPGHTPGSMTLQRGDVVTVGDAVVHSRGRLHENVPWLATNLAEQRASARRLAGTGARVVLPGHYSPCTDPTALTALGRRLERRRSDDLV